MNRYKKKVVLKEEAEKYILKFDYTGIKKRIRRNLPIEPEKPVDLFEIFRNNNPVEIEVGFGTGRFILEYSRKNTHINILGIEITRKMVDHVANKLFSENIENVRVIHFDARPFVQAKIPDKSIQKIHIYFPDPWIKKRHIKRRIINHDFLIAVCRTLKKGGRFNLLTDSKDYFEYFLEHKKDLGKFEDSSDMEDHTPTSYELKWLNRGRKIFRSVLKKP